MIQGKREGVSEGYQEMLKRAGESRRIVEDTRREESEKHQPELVVVVVTFAVCGFVVGTSLGLGFAAGIRVIESLVGWFWG